MSDVNVKIGVELIDYTIKIFNIMNYLTISNNDINAALTDLEAAYIGDAKKEIEEYLKNFSKHIEKMNILYQSLMIYIQGVYDSMEEKDEALAEWCNQLNSYTTTTSNAAPNPYAGFNPHRLPTPPFAN